MSDRTLSTNFHDRASQEKQIIADAIKQRWPDPNLPPPPEVMMLMEVAAAVHTWGATIATYLAEIAQSLPASASRRDLFEGATLVCARCQYRETVTNEREIRKYQDEGSWPECCGGRMLLELMPQQAAKPLEAKVAS